MDAEAQNIQAAQGRGLEAGVRSDDERARTTLVARLERAANDAERSRWSVTSDNVKFHNEKRDLYDLLMEAARHIRAHP